MRYCIYYITTGSYINYADNFFNSLHNFIPDCEKTIVWLSDNFKEYDLPENITVRQIPILDMPWPLVTLLKMHYITNNKLDNYDGYFYFNGNSRIMEMKDTTINIINDALKHNRFLCTKHTYDLYGKPNYIQAGFFGGNEKTFFPICQEVVNSIDDKLRNFKIDRWHDETALNEVLENKRDILCYQQFGLNIVNENRLNDYENTFIILGDNTFKKPK